MLTVVLSLASSFLWFTSFQPKNLESQFIAVERAKHVYYSQYLVNQEFQEAKLPVPMSKNSDSYCGKSLSGFGLEGVYSGEVVGKLQESQKLIQNQSDEIENLSSAVVNDSGILKVSQNLNTYTSNLIDKWQQNQNFYNDVSKLQKKLLGVCLANSQELEQKNNDLKIQVESAKDYDFPAFYAWKVSLKEIILLNEDIISLNKNENKEVKNRKLIEYKKALENIFTIKFDPEIFVNKIEREELNFKNSIKDLEIWEKSNLQSNFDLKNKIVFILI